MNIRYFGLEMVRQLRNARSLIFTFAVPVAMLLIFGSTYGSQYDSASHLQWIIVTTVQMGGYGAMMAALAQAFTIVNERSVGWNRQLRITPLSPGAYFRVKVLTGYMMALASLLVLYAAGSSLGVSLSASEWLKMTGLILVGLVPFAALGVTLGHMLTPDSIGPAMGGGISLLALLGGVWFPLGGNHGFLHDLSQCIPSYWLVQASHVALGGHSWSATGWVVMVVWTVVLSVLAVRAYRRDTGRV
jgi:ABC-2 type transport system permease protein